MYLDCKNKFNIALFGFGLVAIFSGIYFIAYKSATPSLPERDIVLSPHYDDAVLSLGGFLAQNKNKAVVATFFTQNASTTRETKWDKLSGFASSLESFAKRSVENTNALNLLGVQGLDYSFVDFQYRKVGQSAGQSTTTLNELSTSIEELIQKNKSDKINIYGPAFFGDVITHPDHKLLHEAFMEVAKLYANNSNISFFMYEDFPYIQDYNKKNTDSLKSFIEKNDQVSLVPISLKISASDVLLKEQALLKYTSQIKAFNTLSEDIVGESKAFTSTRCGKTACEIVYKIK